MKLGKHQENLKIAKKAYKKFREYLIVHRAFL